MSFILNGLVYDKPMFSIVAYNRAQLATAFEQMEKLRKSGHLAGYVRREAFLQQEQILLLCIIIKKTEQLQLLEKKCQIVQQVQDMV